MNNLKPQNQNFGIQENQKSYNCSRPHNEETANENEAIDEEFTSGQVPDTAHRII